MCQGKAAQEEAARLAEAVAEEKRNVRAALQALEAERNRLTARAEAEKARLQRQACFLHLSTIQTKR